MKYLHKLFLLFFTIINCFFLFQIDAQSWNNDDNADFTGNLTVSFARNRDTDWNNPATRLRDQHRRSRNRHLYAHNEPDLHSCSKEQLRAYFNYRKYTQEQILSHTDLFLSDEFVKVARNCSKYEATVTKLYIQLHDIDWIEKAWLILQGTYCPGLQRRICALYQEVLQKREQREREKQQQEHARQIAKQQQLLAERNAYLQKLDTLKQHDWHSDARLQAIERTRTNPSARASQSFSIDRSVIECAESYGIAHKDLTHGCMNAYEYQLHTEFIDQITQVTELLDAYYRAEQYRLFLDVVGQGVALGIEANHKHEAVIATRWSNFGHEALDVLIGIGEGLLLGTYNTACFAKNVVRHPIRTAGEIAGGFGTIISAVGRAIGVSLNLGGMYITGNSEEAHRRVQEIYDQTCYLMQECTDNLATMSNREIAKQATAFATEWVLMSKAFTFAHSVCSRAKPLIAHSILTLRKKPLRKTVIAGAQGTLNKAGKAAKRVSGAAKEISKESRLALEAFRVDHMAKLEPEIVKLKKTFDCTHKGFAECANKWIKIDYEHILGMELRFSRRGVPQIGGFHHDFMQMVEKNGLLHFAEKSIDTNDFFKADLFFQGVKIKEQATFFPSHWSCEKVIEVIYEAYDNFIKSGLKAKIEDGKYYIKGMTNEGVTIEMYITKKGRIVTAYPTL